MKNIGLILLITCLFSVGCEKEEEYSEVPFIKYRNFNFDIKIIDNAFYPVGYLSFDFIDGDGNIGFTENSDTAIKIEIHDISVYKYKMVNGTFNIADTINFVLPFFNEGVYRKHLIGEMELELFLITDQAFDTIRYDFQIMDRDYNLSNVDSSPNLIIPETN